MVPADGEEPVDTAEKLLQLIADKERLAKYRYIHCSILQLIADKERLAKYRYSTL